MAHWVRLLSMTYATVTELMLLLVQMDEHLLTHQITGHIPIQHLMILKVPLGKDHLVFQIPQRHHKHTDDVHRSPARSTPQCDSTPHYYRDVSLKPQPGHCDNVAERRIRA